MPSVDVVETMHAGSDPEPTTTDDETDLARQIGLDLEEKRCELLAEGFHLVHEADDVHAAIVKLRKEGVDEIDAMFGAKLAAFDTSVRDFDEWVQDLCARV